MSRARPVWTAADVPQGKYLHGSRLEYNPGDLLLTDVVSDIPGEEDHRQMCFATTSFDLALDWAYVRGIRFGGEMLYVYEVEMSKPEVDVNYHTHRVAGEVLTCVMSPRGRVLGVNYQVTKANYPKAIYG